VTACDPARAVAQILRDNDTDPDLKSKAGRALVRRRWSQTPRADRTEATQKARDATLQRFPDAVPASVTDPQERAALTREARRAHMQALALLGTRKRAGG
jgi:hypothetical protein